jgi:hypothetical protein
MTIILTARHAELVSASAINSAIHGSEIKTTIHPASAMITARKENVYLIIYLCLTSCNI